MYITDLYVYVYHCFFFNIHDALYTTYIHDVLCLKRSIPTQKTGQTNNIVFSNSNKNVNRSYNNSNKNVNQ